MFKTKKYKLGKSYRDILQLYLIFVIIILSVYKAPQVVSVGLQTIILVTFYRSKKDYLWLALLFILESYPGALFSRYTQDLQHTISLYQALSGQALYFWMVFIVVAAIKAFKNKKNYKLFYGNNILALIAYLIILFLIFRIYKLTAVTRALLPWLFLFIIPRLIRKDKDYAGFFNLVFSFVFLVILTQTIFIITGKEIAAFLGGSQIILHTEELENVARPVNGIFIPYLALFGSIFYITYKKNFFNLNYLHLILILSLFSILVTATRSWMISTLFIFFGYLFFILKNPAKTFSRIILPALIVFSLIVSIPFIKQQIQLAIVRYETLELLIEGDITVGGTVTRFSERSPRVMKKFYESPVIGWGFGTEAAKFSDGHIGNQNLLMHTGIIGYLLFASLWFYFSWKLFVVNKTLNNRNPYKKTPLLFIIFLIAILIINISAQWFGYLTSFLSGFTISFTFSFANYIYWNSIHTEKEIKIRYRKTSPRLGIS